MKMFISIIRVIVFSVISVHVFAQSDMNNSSTSATSANNLYIDVHHLAAGKVNYKDVAAAHQKDLATEGKYGVQFLNYWVDEDKGVIYCLSSAPDSEAIKKTHAEAHGLMPVQIYKVTQGQASELEGHKNFFLDVHQLGAGNVSAEAVAAAHQKDLAVEKKYGVNFINYWVDEKNGVVICLSQADDSSSIVNTHKEAHGLLPVEVLKVKPGQ